MNVSGCLKQQITEMSTTIVVDGKKEVDGLTMKEIVGTEESTFIGLVASSGVALLMHKSDWLPLDTLIVQGAKAVTSLVIRLSTSEDNGSGDDNWDDDAWNGVIGDNSWNTANSCCYSLYSTGSDSSCCEGSDMGCPAYTNRRLGALSLRDESEQRKLGHCCDHSGWCNCMEDFLANGINQCSDDDGNQVTNLARSACLPPFKTLPVLTTSQWSRNRTRAAKDSGNSNPNSTTHTC